MSRKSEIKSVAVLGLGYVGTVTAACLTERGYFVVGVDPLEAKVRAIRDGLSPVVEPELDVLLESAHHGGLLTATTNCRDALSNADATIVCVGTPSNRNGTLDLGYVHAVAREISEALGIDGNRRHLIVFRSTMLPGSTRCIVSKYFQQHIEAGCAEVWFVPEFLREGTAVADFREPSLAAVGVADGVSVKCEGGFSLFGEERGSVVSWETAETLKYACNSFHATKVAFANEIGRLSKRMNVDSRAVMSLLCKDSALNISSYYMKPGNPYGGSCLPKDVAALNALANQLSVSMPMISGLVESNRRHQEALLDLVTEFPARRIGLLGLSFKNATDDLRNSPMVMLAESLIGRGYTVEIFDPNLNPARLLGANREAAIARLPHLERLLKLDVGEVITACEILVVAQKCVSLDVVGALVRPEQNILDVNGWAELEGIGCGYHGFCW